MVAKWIVVLSLMMHFFSKKQKSLGVDSLKFDFEKNKQIQKISAEEMLTFDDNLCDHYVFSNEEIYDLVTEK